MKKTFSITSLLFASLVTFGSVANQEKLKVSGFGTIASATADTSSFEFRTDRSQASKAKKDGFAFKPLSLIGVQLDYSFSNKLHFVGQYVYREQDRQNLDSITQMAFLRYDVTPRWEVRAGRVAADIFYFSDTRDVSISYPWVKVPTEVYGIVPARSFDGLDISYLKPYDNFNLTVKGFFGEGESDFTSDEYLPIKFANLSTISLEFNSFDWKLAFKHTQTQAENDNPESAFIAPAVAQLQPIWSEAQSFSETVTLKGADITYTSLSYNQYFGDWELSGELAHIDSDSIGLRHSINGFVNVSYLLGAHTFFGLYSFADTDSYYLSEERPDFPIIPETAQLAFFVEEVGNSLAHNQESVSVGWRWDVKENIALKVQLERTDIEARGGGLRARNGPVILGDSEVAHTLFLALSFSF